MKIETWQGHEIRFIEKNGEWWAILKDICDALNLKTRDVSKRLDPDMMERVEVDLCYHHPAKYKEKDEVDSNNIDILTHNKTYHMLAVNEYGIYEALFASRRLEARKFRRWSATVMTKLRKHVGLEGYEIMKMTDPQVQKKIDCLLDDIFYDESTGKVMRSVTVPGGDVEQVPFV